MVEGHLAVTRLLASPYQARSLLVADTRLARAADLVARALDAGCEVLSAPRDVVATTVGFDLHRGVVAIGVRPPAADAADILDLGPAGETDRLGAGSRPLLVVTEGVNDHENLGALFRNAAAFGVAGVLLDPTSADPLYRRSIRVSMGHVLGVPFARLPDWPEGLGRLRDAGFAVVALTPTSGATPLAAVAPSGPVAVLVGAEGPGLSAGALGAADVEARIPMAGDVDSLNVATAAAVALYHFAGLGTGD